MKNAVLYARYSSNMQTENSIEAQKLALYGYAKDNGFKIITEYIDRAKSGTTVAKRDEFNRMLAESAEGEFDYVIVHKFDRFARNRNDSRASKRILEENGVKVISVLEPISDNPEGIIMEGLAETMSEYYSANLSREVKKGFNVRALKCQNNGGRPPLGYMVDRQTETFIINENEAKIVRLIFDLYTKGNSYGYILNELNTRGYKTRLGNPFGKNSLHEIIRNKKYCGYYIFNRRMSKKFGKVNSHKNRPQEEIIEIKGGIPAIISEEAYNKAMAIMETHKRSPAQNCAKHIYLLSGLVMCGHCGETMHGNTHTNVKGSVFHSYRCEKKCDKSCPNLEISQERLDDYVLKILEDNIFNKRIFNTLIQSLKASSVECLKSYTALHKILCKSKSDQAKGGLRSKHDLGFPLNCMVPVGRDGMRVAGVNTVSAHGKNIKRGNPIMRSLCPQTLSKVDWIPYPNFDRLPSNVTQCFSTPNTKFCVSCRRS